MTDAVNSEVTAEVKSTRKAVLARIERLPSLSTVVSEFLEISRSELFSGKDFERVICKDQVLVGRLLKVANSGMYGRSRSIKTISDAVVRIGLDEIKKIVYAVSNEGLLRRDFKVYRYPDKGFWKHSMGVGVVCRSLMEESSKAHLAGEQSFIAGLVHDVGKLLIDDFLDAGPGVRHVDMTVEKETVGLDHAELGERIMTSWSIPEEIAEAVKYHHDPHASGGLHRGALAVNAADKLCNMWGVGTQPYMDLGEEIDKELFREILDEFKITDAKWEEILWDVRQKLAGLEELYGGND